MPAATAEVVVSGGDAAVLMAGGGGSMVAAAFIKVIKQSNNNSMEWVGNQKEREVARKVERASERDIPRRWKEESERRYRKTEQKRETEHRRTATRPDRPVAQPAHVYLALLHRTPILRGSHWWIGSPPKPRYSTYHPFLLIVHLNIPFPSKRL